MTTDWRPHSSHWGAFFARSRDGEVELRPHPGDPHPSPMLDNFRGVLSHPARVRRPAFRKAWLDGGPGSRPRGFDDAFVELDWDEALDVLAGELRRVVTAQGPRAVYGGSYGWASAGRFHHAQSQIHRFLNIALGGYVRSVNSYSAGASSVLLPHVIAPFEPLSRDNVTWDALVEHTEVVVAFGGMALRNAAIGNGGVSRHIEHSAMRAAAARGCRFHLVSPIRDDLPNDIGAQWTPIRPGTDAALMLAMAHTLIDEDLYDRAQIAATTVGFDRFRAHVLGLNDGVAKSPEWAEPITGVPAERARELARDLTRGRSLLTASHSLQRADHGEQPIFACVCLAALVGQLGLPGGGFNYALGQFGHTGRRRVAVDIPTLSQGRNGVSEFIPVARIADMLLHSGETFEYDGRTLRYPDVRLIYWAGGNPFHHHQDLARLHAAFARPETIVCHETGWTATARASDIVLPATMTLERDDLGAARTDPLLIAMRRVAAPAGEARDDYAIFADLATRLGRGEAFTEGRDAQGWLRCMYGRLRDSLHAAGVDAPDFETFWDRGELTLPLAPDDGGLLRRFRDDPQGAPLATASGKIELHCATIADFGYDDCPGCPTYILPREPVSDRHPLVVIAHQPAARLHSQLDYGAHSASTKRAGREVLRINPADAGARGIAQGDVVRLFNARGACLASAEITADVMPGVVAIATGSWLDPVVGENGILCARGNPNMLTGDVGTSRLAQGCTGQLTVGDVERAEALNSAPRAHAPPSLEHRERVRNKI